MGCFLERPRLCPWGLAFGGGVGVASAVVGFVLMLLALVVLRGSRDKHALRRPLLYTFLLGPLAALVIVLFIGPN